MKVHNTFPCLVGWSYWRRLKIYNRQGKSGKREKTTPKCTNHMWTFHNLGKSLMVLTCFCSSDVWLSCSFCWNISKQTIHKQNRKWARKLLLTWKWGGPRYLKRLLNLVKGHKLWVGNLPVKPYFNALLGSLGGYAGRVLLTRKIVCLVSSTYLPSRSYVSITSACK